MHCQCADDPNLNEEVSRFNLAQYPLLSIPDNDMINEDINYILLQINMSVPAENPESRRCVLVAFAYLHIHERHTRHVTCVKNYKYLLRQLRIYISCSKMSSFNLVFNLNQ